MGERSLDLRPCLSLLKAFRVEESSCTPEQKLAEDASMLACSSHSPLLLAFSIGRTILAEDELVLSGLRAFAFLYLDMDVRIYIETELCSDFGIGKFGLFEAIFLRRSIKVEHSWLLKTEFLTESFLLLS